MVRYEAKLMRTIARTKERVNTQSRQRRGGVTDLYALDYVSEISNGIINSGTSISATEGDKESNADTDGKENGDVVKRIKQFTRAVKKVVPNATAEGIAGMVGNFGVESEVTAKRYETDYLTNYAYGKVGKNPTAEGLVGSWGAFLGMYGGTGLNEAGYLGSDGQHWIGIGLGQWTGPRGEKLKNYAESKGSSIFAFKTQVEFMFNEEGRLSEIAKQVATSTAPVADNVTRFLAEWEGVPGNALDRRIEYANTYLEDIRSALGDNSSEDNGEKETNPSQDLTALWKKVYNVTDAGDANLQPHARRARHFIMEAFGITEAGGYRPDDDGQGTGHGAGLAIDFMVGPYGSADDPQGKGQAIANFLAQNMEALQISYIIWQQKFYMGQQNIYGPANTWNNMPDRGSNTQNHFDHVHVSFIIGGGNQPEDLTFSGSSEVKVDDGIEDIIDSTPSKNKGESIHRVLIPGDLDRFQRWFVKVLVSNNAEANDSGSNVIPVTDARMTINATNSKTGKSIEIDVTQLLKHEHPCDWIGSKSGAEAVYPSEDPMRGYDIMNLAWYLNNEQRDILYSPGEKIFTIKAFGTAKITLRNFLKFSHIN